MATIIEQFVARLNWDVNDKGVKQFQKNMGDVAQIAKVAATAIAGATAAAVGFAVVTNKQTAINTNLARSVGLSAESFDAWAGLLEQMGFDGERVVDLVEEMNNKLGEMKGLGEMTAVSEGLKILGLEFKKIRDLKPEEQFLEILSTAKEMEDQQKAVSAVDMIMGGEANKVVGFLRTIDGDLDGIIKRRMQLNLLDEEAREGAVKFNLVWADMLGVVKSLGAQFSGLLGDAITPLVNEFTDWVVANREIIKSNLKGFVNGLASAIKFIVPWIARFVGFVSDGVKALGGFRSMLRLIGFSLAAFSLIKIIAGIVAFTKAVWAAGVAQTFLNLSVMAIPALIAAAAVALALIAEDIYQFMTGGESVTEKVVDSVVGMWREAVPLVEGYIDDAVSYWADALGIPKADIVDFLIDVEQGFRDTFRSITNWIQDLPWIGRFFGGGEAPTQTAGPAPSPSAVQAGNVNNNRVVINSPVEIRAASDVDVDRAVRMMHDAMQEAASTALRANDKGVVY